MMLISALSFYQVVTRYAFNNPSTWSEELIRFIFVWASCLGAAIGIKEHIHIGIDVIVNFFSPKIRMVVDVIIHLVLGVFAVFMIKYGYALTLKTRVQLSPALRIPMSYVYLAVPVMGVLIIFYASLEIARILKQKGLEEQC